MLFISRGLTILIALLLLVYPQYAHASSAESESSRLLVHTLNYMATDYPNGVSNGKVINKEEYEEMLGFSAAAIRYYHQDAPLWPAADTLKIGSLIYMLDSLVHVPAGLADVSQTANAARAAVIKASGLTVAPEKYPSLADGRAVYMANCARCHGNSGHGEGPEGKGLDPQPRNFYEDARMAKLSPFSVYNTVRCGVQGTGMKAHSELSDAEVWDVAFYVLSLRYKQETDKDKATAIFKDKFSTLTLEQIALKSDNEIAASMKAEREDLSVLRYYQIGEAKGQFIDAALKYIDESMAASREGNYEQAEKLSALAYLEGIEPIEKQLAATDPALMQRIEEQMANTRKALASHRPLSDVNDSLKQSRQLITQAGDVISTGHMSPLLAFVMAISILLREGLEAFLVIMVILGVIKASGLSSPMVSIHAGWVSAVFSGIVLWMIGGRIIQAHMAQVELMEGVIGLVAVVMLLYIGFWLHGKSEVAKWKEYVTNKIKNISGTESLLGLFALSFFVVFREVFESVLFLSAINIQAGGKEEEPIIAGVVVAFAMVIGFAALVLKFSARLPIPKLFKISSMVMGLLAVVLAGKGIHSFQETGHIAIHGLGFMPRLEVFELLGIFPTIETLLAQSVVLGILFFVMRTANKPKAA